MNDRNQCEELVNETLILRTFVPNEVFKFYLVKPITLIVHVGTMQACHVGCRYLLSNSYGWKVGIATLNLFQSLHCQN